MNLYNFIEMLSDLCTPEDVIIPSSAGFASEVTQQAWRVKHGQRIICNPGLGSMGFALPHAIGISVASNRRIIVIEGDGSLQHNLQELATIARLNLNIKLFVINNGGYASIRNTHNKFFNNNPVEGLTFPDLKKIAKAYFMQYYDLVSLEQLKFILRQMSFDFGSICEVMIDPDQKKELV